MPNDRLDENGKQLLVMPAVLDLTTADTLKQSLLNALACGPVVEIDAGAVQRITSPCLQVFAAAAKGLPEIGGTMRFTNVPDIFRETADTLGLSELLGLAEV